MADTAAETVTAGGKKEKMLTLRSSDGEEFQVEQSVATESQTIKHMIEEGCVNTGIPLPNVTARILSKVIVFCRKHAQVRVPDAEDGEASSKPERTSTEDLKAFDKDFVEVDQATLFELILAANYLDIKRLLDLTAQAIADIIKEKTPEEIRTTFNIKNDFTPDEEAGVRREAQWAFE